MIGRPDGRAQLLRIRKQECKHSLLCVDKPFETLPHALAKILLIGCFALQKKHTHAHALTLQTAAATTDQPKAQPTRTGHGRGLPILAMLQPYGLHMGTAAPTTDVPGAEPTWTGHGRGLPIQAMLRALKVPPKLKYICKHYM